MGVPRHPTEVIPSSPTSGGVLRGERFGTACANYRRRATRKRAFGEVASGRMMVRDLQGC